MITNFNIRAGAKLSLFGYYSLNYANSDAIGAEQRNVFNNFPSDQYDLSLDYGRASFAIRDRLFMGGTIGLPRGFRLSPFMIFNSGSPYNVTVGQDLSGDLLFNDRPAFARPILPVRARRRRWLATTRFHDSDSPTLRFRSTI